MNSQSHLPVFRVDAFVAKGFLGNVACVMPLTEWLDDDQLLRIAADNGVPETAYTVKSGSEYQLRWFTPDIEMDLCGHATLAAGHIVLTELEPDSDFVAFSSVSGPLKVSRKEGKYAMHLPLRPAASGAPGCHPRCAEHPTVGGAEGPGLCARLP